MRPQVKNRKVAISIFAIIILISGIVWVFVTEEVKIEHKGFLVTICVISITLVIGGISEILKQFKEEN